MKLAGPETRSKNPLEHNCRLEMSADDYEKFGYDIEHWITHIVNVARGRGAIFSEKLLIEA